MASATVIFREVPISLNSFNDSMATTVTAMNLWIYSIRKVNNWVRLVQLGSTVETIYFNTLSGELTAKRQGKRFEQTSVENQTLLDRTFNGIEEKLKQVMELSWYCPHILALPRPNLM